MPHIEAAVKKVRDVPGGYLISGFIFRDDVENPVLIRFGNAPVEGEDLIKLHSLLSYTAAVLEDKGLLERADFPAAPTGPTSEEIADKLAVMLLERPPQDDSDEVIDLVTRYIQSRKE